MWYNWLIRTNVTPETIKDIIFLKLFLTYKEEKTHFSTVFGSVVLYKFFKTFLDPKLFILGLYSFDSDIGRKLAFSF